MIYSSLSLHAIVAVSRLFISSSSLESSKRIAKRVTSLDLRKPELVPDGHIFGPALRLPNSFLHTSLGEQCFVTPQNSPMRFGQNPHSWLRPLVREVSRPISNLPFTPERKPPAKSPSCSPYLEPSEWLKAWSHWLHRLFAPNPLEVAGLFQTEADEQ